MKKIISTDTAPSAIGPYSQGVKINDLLFLSGQIPIDPHTNELVNGGIESQTHQVFANIKAILASEGLTFNNVIKTTVFMMDLTDFQKMNDIYCTYFEKNPPARSCVEVAKLPKGADIEIEVIASYSI